MSENDIDEVSKMLSELEQKNELGAIVDVSETEIRQNRIPNVLEKLEEISQDITKAERRYFVMKVLSQASKYVMGLLVGYHVEIIPDYKNEPLSVTIRVYLDDKVLLPEK